MSKKHETVIDRIHPAGMGGTQRVYRFGNGYGASVVQFPGSYGNERGLWELAVIRFNGPNHDDFRLDYQTPITDDVIGFLSAEKVATTLDQIAALPALATTNPA